MEKQAYELVLGAFPDVDEAPHAAAVAEFDHAGYLREQRVVLAPAHVLTGLELGAPLPYDDRSAGDELSAEDLHTQALCIRIAPVFGTA